jgi:archaetidylinositol phosphate synthase
MHTHSAAGARTVEFRTAQRVNQSLTADVERRILCWLAQRAPDWVSSDQLTALGLLAQIAAGACYVLARWHRRALLAVIVCIALNWLGDSLDGTLARTRGKQRPRYGFYVDHVVDLFGAVGLIGGLGWSGMVHWPVAMAMLVGFLLLSAESYLATYTSLCFQMSKGVFGPTEIRILLILGNLALLRDPYCTVFGARLLLFDLGGTIAAGGMFAMAVSSAMQRTAELYREEPLL